MKPAFRIFGRLLEQKFLACSRRRERSRHSNDH
jgi:hypothetical protein